MVLPRHLDTYPTTLRSDTGLWVDESRPAELTGALLAQPHGLHSAFQQLEFQVGRQRSTQNKIDQSLERCVFTTVDQDVTKADEAESLQAQRNLAAHSGDPHASH